MTKVSEAHLEARRQSILDAAFRVFARRGIRAATMAEIAEAASLSPGAIYRYYANKDALVNSCFQESAVQLADDWRRRTAAAQDPLAVFNEIAGNSFAQMKEPGEDDHTRVLLEHLLEVTRTGDAEALAAARTERETIVGGLRDALTRVRESGQLPDGIEPEALAQALMSFYMGARMARLLDPAMDTDAQLAQVHALMVLARRASPPREP